MVIANCVTILRRGGAEAALSPGMLAALRNLVEESAHSDSADRSAGLAAVISLGLRGAQGRASCCRHQPRPAMHAPCNCRGAEYDSMRAEALMAAVNLAENADTVRGMLGFSGRWAFE